jgi:hypothetical protein
MQMSTSIQEKIQQILKAIQSGISIYKIDPVGKGNSAKHLLNGRMPTRRKIDDMFAKVLLFELQKNAVESEEQKQASENQTPSIIPETLGESAEILNDRMKKIKAIIEAANSGISHNIINPVGNGGSIRRLLNGGNPTPRKIDAMYENILRFQQKQLIQTTPEFMNLIPEENPNNQQKKNFILQAVAAGFQRTKIDSAAQGKSIRRLEKEANIRQETLDLMYSNLLNMLGYSEDDESDRAANKKRINLLTRQISSLQSLVSSLFDKVHSLETSLTIIQNQIQPTNKKQPPKMLGVTITQKADKVKGHTYKRWYGIYTDAHNKKRWIYIGKDVSKAKQKILGWFQRHPQDVHPIHFHSATQETEVQNETKK